MNTTTITPAKLTSFIPTTTASCNWMEWIAIIDLKTCVSCQERHGKIYSTHFSDTPPLHPYCRCMLIPLQSLNAGNASHEGTNGADWWLKIYQTLPSYYLSEAECRARGWAPGKAPADYAPGKMLTKGAYQNRDGRLPSSPGRIWYEADLNYYQGRRNSHRIVWSNDGLIFVTYDHYSTFIEVK